jgi:dTDP-4-dehydrorhamnose 3,5-epimerase-like enzyme
MISECRIIDLPKIDRREGNITPVEGGNHIPFDIARVYYMYDIPGGQSRGGHAHKQLEQLIVSAMGSFDVVVDDGKDRRTFHLDRAYYGLYVPRMMWRELVNFSSGSICLVMASLLYNEDEYIRDYSQFAAARPAA